MLARAAIRDVGRVLGLGYGEVDRIAKAVPNSLAQAREQKPLSLWQMLKKMCSQDTRRALSAMLGVLESFGKSLGSVAAAKPHPAESDLTEIESPAKLARKGP